MNSKTSAHASSWYVSPTARRWDGSAPGAGARQFHHGLPGYAPTPLVELPTLALELGVARVLVKDESSRLGLPAFKMLGASWAVARLVSSRTGAAVEDMKALRRAASGSGLVLVTATDGNHGRAVAHMARLMGVAATVFVPAVMTQDAADAIAGEGAQVVRTGGTYDEAVQAAADFAQADNDRELVQDTSWAGYELVPSWIVEGYETLLDEIDSQLASRFGSRLDLVAVPVGVGSLAQAVVAHYRRSGSPHPCVLSVEPDTAACVLASLAAGTPVSVTTGRTVMAGLNCGTISSAAWSVLRDGCDAAVSVGDDAATKAVEDLRTLGISSGPSGAATLAGLRAALAFPDRRAVLGIDEASTVVLLSTEGAR